MHDNIGSHQSLASGFVTDSFAQVGTDHRGRYWCLFPGCYAKFDTQWKLDTHAQVHFSNAAPHHVGALGYDGNFNHLGTFPYDDPFGTDSPSMYGFSTPGMVPNISAGIPEPAFPSMAWPYHGDITPHGIGAMASDPSTTMPGDGDPSPPPMPDRRFACAVCGKTCAR
ncbi:MAG: hypothetical protein Q9196_007125, partial [Gyalolechia fulgens]